MDPPTQPQPGINSNNRNQSSINYSNSTNVLSNPHSNPRGNAASAASNSGQDYSSPSRVTSLGLRSREGELQPQPPSRSTTNQRVISTQNNSSGFDSNSNDSESPPRSRYLRHGGEKTVLHHQGQGSLSLASQRQDNRRLPEDNAEEDDQHLDRRQRVNTPAPSARISGIRQDKGTINNNTQGSFPSNQHQTYRVLNVNDQVRITAWTYEQITAARNYWER